ncbi:hypothetical protein NOU13_27460 [Rhodococcus erythropolis]|jgi:hypothetical protein|nr:MULTISPECIES: hypothetical protein [Rhodococcus erythropolis group]MCQ4128245.1 hypothetical protein [Rhodococcus erythropolis]MDT9664634.1 hypothetical protein [Rhodococcus qingshengii]
MSSHDSNRPHREKIRHLAAQAWIEIRYGYRLNVTINSPMGPPPSGR